MRTLIALIAALLILSAGLTAVTKKKKSSVAGKKKSTVTAKKAPAKKTTSRAASSKKRSRTGSKTTSKKKVSSKKTRGRKTTARNWRSRQLAPTPERYREIQQALIDKGYLTAEATGRWDQASIDALRRFQQEQKLEPTGKINSLSLIALGLGPKYDTSAAVALPPPLAKP